ncbi:MAG: hypothetical protein IPM32_01475 [Ignavibacteriae bacterium]|nr:hypothetical protein [Ignavibacteriota bacterium]
MKNIFTKINLIIFFLLTGYNLSIAQVSEADAKILLSKIFDLSVNEDYNNASNLILYEKVNEKRSYNASVNDELKSVKRQCKKIKAYIDLSDSYEFSGYRSSNINNFNGGILNVIFKSSDQKLNISFSFVNVSGKILLAEFK